MRRPAAVSSVIGVVIAILGSACAAAPVATPSAPPGPSESTAASPSSTAAMGHLRIPRVTGPPQPLEAGTYVSPEGFTPAMTVTVPDGWYGGGGSSGWAVGQGNDAVQQRFAGGGFFIDVIPTPYEEAVATFGRLDGLVVEAGPIVGELAGWKATTFEGHASGEPVALDDIAPGPDIGPDSTKQIFVDADGSTLLIRTEVFDESARPQLDQVLASLAPA